MYSKISEMEPMLPKADKLLADLALLAANEASALGKGLHPITRETISKLLLHINSYYSNLIEGNHTLPSDIEKAVRKDYADDPDKRALQELSLAHILTQEYLNDKLSNNSNVNICSQDFLCDTHQFFYTKVPDKFKKIKIPNSDDTIELIPGDIRKRNVVVGNHIPPDFLSLGTFLNRFADVYNDTKFSGHNILIAIAASHHRLTWIHPFLDGNGRISRLFTHAYFRKTGLDSDGLWSFSRGMARSKNEYLSHLALADSPRMGDYDGRGNLSQKGLYDFCDYFLEICLDQIRFMGMMLDFESWKNRIFGYVQLRSQTLIHDAPMLRVEAKYVLAELVYHGELRRSDAIRITGLGERTGRTLISQMLTEGLISSKNHRSPVKLEVPEHVIGYYFPKLYPDGLI